jgi:tripartite ATP-independent transporter DctP family solute receptor
LGDDAAMVTALRTGALDISANSQGAVANAVPEYAAFGMPFLFSSPAAAFKLLDGPLGKELADRSAEKGMILLGTWDNGIRHMTNSKRAITKVEDMKGLKIRVPPDATLVDIMKALGAESQQIKFAELYVALQQGVVDGQENPLANIHASKLYEVQKHLALTNHQFQMTPLLMSKRTWDKLSAADRKVVMEAAADATALQRKLSREADEKLLADLKAKGVQVTTPPTRGRLREGHRGSGRQVDVRPRRPLREEGHRGPLAPSDLRRVTRPGAGTRSSQETPMQCAESSVIERGIAALCRVVLWLSTGVIFVILVANTILRYATGSSLQWANEVPELLFPWLVMSGVVLAALHGAHIATTFLMEALRPRVRRIVSVVGWSVVSALYATLTVATFRMLEVVHDEKSPILQLPGSITYACVMVGMGLLALLAAQSAWRGWCPARESEPVTGVEHQVRTAHW